MSACSTIVFIGTVNYIDFNSTICTELENRKHPLQIEARRFNLDVFWFERIIGGKEKLVVLLGKNLGSLGDEHNAMLSLPITDVNSMLGDLKNKVYEIDKVNIVGLQIFYLPDE